MKSVVNNPVLLVNANWQGIGTTDVQSALSDMNSLNFPKWAFKIEYHTSFAGVPDFNEVLEIYPVPWDQWVELEPRPFDKIIRSQRMAIRAPTVVIARTYAELPVKTIRATKRNLMERYKNKCYWTGEELSFKEATIEHIISQDVCKRTGQVEHMNSWPNLAPARKDINFLKGNMSPEEFTKKHGYRPQYKLSQPAPVRSHLLVNAVHADWKYFLTGKS